MSLGRLVTMADNTPPPQVWPTLRARDARGLIRFLVDAFGFEETVVYGEGDQVEHAQLSWPLGGGIMLGSVREAGPDGGWPLQPGSFGAYVVTDDPDGLFARAIAAGAEILRACTRPTTARGISPPATRKATAGPSAPTAANRERAEPPCRPALPPTRPVGEFTHFG